MKKVIRMTESELIGLVKKIIKEQPMDAEFDARMEKDRSEGLVLIQNKSAEEVQEELNNLPENLKFLTITNSEYADFETIDCCQFSELILVNLRGTPNNFVENCDCEYSDLAPSMYEFPNYDRKYKNKMD